MGKESIEEQEMIELERKKTGLTKVFCENCKKHFYVDSINRFHPNNCPYCFAENNELRWR